MCGRFNLTDNPAVHELLDDLGIDIGPLPIRFNIAPTDSVLTITAGEGELKISEMRWWLVPSWSDGPSQKFAMFNARSESIRSSRAYRRPFARQRAVIPACSFIEWQKQNDTKQPYLIGPASGALFFAAVWDRWQSEDRVVYSCSMITTASTDAFTVLHHRRPVMLESEHIKAWLSNDTDAEELQALMQTRMPSGMDARAIATTVNNARNKIEPEQVNLPRIQLS